MALEFRNVTKRFTTANNALTAVSDVNFRVAPGEFVSVVGPSGCGKSTILSMTAGLYQPTEGEVLVSDAPVTGPNSHVGFMLQKDLLLPWRSIISNIEFGLEARGVAKAERRDRAMKELAHCQLAGFENHYPYQLSGGMRQRAALARTLAIDPEIILLDEPFSALDAQTKLLLQNSFAGTIAETGKTTLLITHDLHEAVLMSDRILVLSERPGTIVAEIEVDLPRRDRPLERRVMPQVADYAAQLFKHLKLEEKAA
ncbi:MULTISPECIES: ABC transporter ATP-binding protein [unclassified Sulfitobacter]|uniref:ABC transporter ATP-binding protein n=1 Tax=unclassified Sulfitobacter TaxID=196795 RepID=UPI0007C2585C|nr:MULTISPECIES: ABC transporter ATP-binding protein [unclassified Sulfitobacter]MAM25301.1 ABC transporter ATP-binding protein [Paracoccaceae bacterium]KZX96881.1 ABC transporter ATP-binding protein [Sulfitobacter sp. HI0023]KZY24073.1 ABC transporter ATP-binding protein [Sulfitobacter sp. HI0040]KZZ62595.1 ABC transporter ATP-binding protein [Sulfitobacter sp. HI0129]MBO28085.1 ABC transporter ATP-binding protein [Paracoccaceae bacterium]|tara:strand:- start:248 stop:1015 length:768 start_codon:yes stop_codon:yes gene_type:complete